MLRFLQQLLGAARASDSGRAGERLAAEWLARERGFAIVARNWRSPRDRRDELDLVGRDGEVLVFVEVKTRAAGALVPGYYAVDARKKRAVQRAAEAYLAGLAEKPRTFRFDVVEVATPAAKPGGATTSDAAAAPEILHFENVPLFPKHFRG
ncbi:MAG TPA: YraN family protein [Opitutaceae bacterium]|nr:YraN family protein [Opitutaceae bacterium]